MTNIVKKGGGNSHPSILINKQLVIISMFPVCTGINRVSDVIASAIVYVPCTSQG